MKLDTATSLIDATKNAIEAVATNRGGNDAAARRRRAWAIGIPVAVAVAGALVGGGLLIAARSRRRTAEAKREADGQEASRAANEDELDLAGGDAEELEEGLPESVQMGGSGIGGSSLDDDELDPRSYKAQFNASRRSKRAREHQPAARAGVQADSTPGGPIGADLTRGGLLESEPGLRGEGATDRPASSESKSEDANANVRASRGVAH